MPDAITICFTYFRSVALANLAAALYTVRQQDLSRVAAIIVVDNNTADPAAAIQAILDPLAFPVPVKLLSFKHGDSAKTHPWSTNRAVREATTPWVLVTRADYLLDFTFVRKVVEVADAHAYDWAGFVTGNVYHLTDDIAACERTAWREQGPRVLRALPGAEADYTAIDTGVWLSRRDAFHHVGGLDESLSAWGHAQTHFQHKLYQAGVDFWRIPEVLFYHPQHAAERDIDIAHQQLRDHGLDLKAMWARYEGVSPY